MINIGDKHRPRRLKVMVLGQNGVGKSALVVRFITRRFIGDYASDLEKIYDHLMQIDNEFVKFDVLDWACRQNVLDNCESLERNILWADVFILMYSITDKCSFDECIRFKFLINYIRRGRKSGTSTKDSISEVPVILVGNKTDQERDRMISVEEGKRRSRELSCACFYEISIRENIDQVLTIFRNAYRFWNIINKYPKLKRSTSDVQHTTDTIFSPNFEYYFYDKSSIINNIRGSFITLGNSYLEEMGSSDSNSLSSSNNEIDLPFRSRASTEGTLSSRPRRWRYPPPGLPPHKNRVERRMSISTRGSDGSD